MRRTLWAVLGLALIVVAVVESVSNGWMVGATVIVFALLPDVTLIGAFDPERKGMLRPERVMSYNVMHLARLPAILAATGALIQSPQAGGLEFGSLMFAAGVAWLAHVAVDRAAGYRLRDREGAIPTVAGRSAPGLCQP